ncbi:MAG: hypothetical protein WA996_10305 [Candidatus Promineifilaceae bacterium]
MFDIVGIIILVVLIVVFGFLATRARKVKNVVLKWVSLLITGLLTLVSVAMLVLALVGFSKLNAQYDNPIAGIQVTGSPPQIARG